MANDAESRPSAGRAVMALSFFDPLMAGDSCAVRGPPTPHLKLEDF